MRIRKTWLAVCVAGLFFTLPVQGAGTENQRTEEQVITENKEEDTEQKSEGENSEDLKPEQELPEEPKASSKLLLDDKNIYEGMTKAYQDGYEPVVENNVVTVVLPLQQDVENDVSSIQAVPDLGDVANSPFVFKNYQKTFSCTKEPVSGSEEMQDVFLLRFDLDLKEEYINGTYPVNIHVEYKSQGEDCSQEFMTYVQLTQGKDGEEEEDALAENPGGIAETITEQQEEKPTSEPKLILSKCEGMPEKIESGSEISLKAILKNTNKNKYVQNITVSVSCEEVGISLAADSNVFYFERVEPGTNLELPLKFKISEKTLAGRYNIVLDMSYDNPEATALTSSGKIELLISQKTEVGLEVGATALEINAGDSMEIPVQAMNLGRGMVYNVRCNVDVPGLKAEKSLFLGNLEGGSASSGTIKVFAGMIDENAENKENRYGKTSGKILLIFEDEEGKEFTKEQEMNITINPLEIETDIEMPAETEDKTANQMVGGILALLFIAGIGTAVPIIRRRQRMRKHEED